MHMSRAEGAVIVEPVAVAKALHLLAEQPCALVESLQLPFLRHFLVPSTAKQYPLHGHCRCVSEAVMQHLLK
jgi:hypothetical protein